MLRTSKAYVIEMLPPDVRDLLTGVVQDPEKNKPGEKGIHLTAKQKAALQAAKDVGAYELLAT